MSVAAVAGVGIYTGVVLGFVAGLARYARKSRILLPFLVALFVRLTVMLVAHFISVSHGAGGLFYLDDRGYDAIGRHLAHAWRHGHFVDIESSRYAGSLLFGYDALVGGIYTLAGSHVIAVKIVNVVLGAAAVLLASKLAGRVLGSAAEQSVAWVVALFPTLIWWSSTMLKEALVGVLLLTALVATFYLYKVRGFAVFVVTFLALSITRMPAAIAVVLTLAVALSVATFRRRHEIDWRALAGSAVAVLVLLVVTAAAIGRGSPRAFVSQYRYTFRHLTHFYGKGNVTDVPIDLARTLAMPHPWVFDAASRTWDRALYPGMWLWYALLPMAIIGAWRLRRQLDALLVIVPIVVVLVIDAFLVGPAFRQRSTIEPLLLVLVVAGFVSFRNLALVASAGLMLAATSALVQTHAELVAALVAAGAVALALVSRVFPCVNRAVPVKYTSCLESCVVRIKLPDSRYHWSRLREVFSSRPKQGNAS